MYCISARPLLQYVNNKAVWEHRHTVSCVCALQWRSQTDWHSCRRAPFFVNSLALVKTSGDRWFWQVKHKVCITYAIWALWPHLISRLIMPVP